MKINLSPSFLIKVYSSGYDFAVGQKLGLIDKPPTAAMNDGKLFHALIAEKLGAKTDSWVVSPYDSFRSKAAQDWRDSQPDDVLIVKEEQVAKLIKIADRAISHPKIKPLLEKAKAEQVIEKQVKGFNIKGILDVVSEFKGKTVIDWKFVSSKNFDNFKKVALYDNYDLQGAVYDYLADATHVYFAAVESEPPHRIKLFYCDQSFLESGADKFNAAFRILSKEKWRQPNFDIDDVEDLVSWNHYNG